MSLLTPTRMLIIGFILVMAGVVLPFLMVTQVLESTLFLNFFSYFISLIGVILGGFGATMMVRTNRRK